MGVDITVLDFLLKFKGAISGRTLQLGRQQVFVPTDEASAAYLAAQDVLRKYDPVATIAPLLSNGGSEALFRYLGATELHSMDASSFEGADITWDLNNPVPQELDDRFDTIFDGGTSEHVFDVRQVFENIGRMLKRGGMFLSVTPANDLLGHGFYQFSPELMWRIFSAENGYEVLSIQTACISIHPEPVDAPDPARAGQRLQMGTTGGPAYLMVAARKVSEPPAKLSAQQSDYKAAWTRNG